MLARLLGPHAFGTYAVAYVALVAVLNFNELGVSLAIVRWPGDPAEIVPTVTAISLAVSAFIYVVCFFAAPAYASAMGVPAATTVVRVLSLAILSDGFTNTPAALLQRNFRQGQRTVADQVNVWLSTAVTVALAWSGYGAMSLAIGRLVGCVAGAILLLAFAPESIRVGFDPAKARALLRFGLPLAGAGLLTFAVGSVDQIIVGHMLGPIDLGFYVLALNLAGWPIAMFSQPVRVVGPAVFARLQHDAAAMRTTFVSAAALLCAVAVPVCLLIAGAATPLVSFVYGVRWVPAARPLLWLALLGGVQVFFLLAYDLFVVLARSRFLLVTQLGWLVALVVALAVGAHLDGIYGASLAEFGVAAFFVLPRYLIELSRAGIGLSAIIRHVWLPLAGASVAGVTALVTAEVAPNDFTALVVSGLATVVITGLLIYHMRPVIAMLRSPSIDAATSPSTESIIVGPASYAGISAEDAAEYSAAERDDRAVGFRAPDHPFVDPYFARVPANYSDILRLPPSRLDLSMTTPLYHKTVASLNWDPGELNGSKASDRPGPEGSDVPTPALTNNPGFGVKLTATAASILPDVAEDDSAQGGGLA
jgi:O-antigen/teichoic acid export membrane protein